MATASWLAALIAVIMLLLQLKQGGDAKTSGDFTPQQVQEILQMMHDDHSLNLPPDPADYRAPSTPSRPPSPPREPRGHEPCVCGSGKKYRDCCRQ
jgi:uncharacterized protein YecA (UPF0149 family)